MRYYIRITNVEEVKDASRALLYQDAWQISNGCNSQIHSPNKMQYCNNTVFNVINKILKFSHTSRFSDGKNER